MSMCSRDRPSPTCHPPVPGFMRTQFCPNYHCEQSPAISLMAGTFFRERDRPVAALLLMTTWAFVRLYGPLAHARRRLLHWLSRGGIA